MRIIVDFNPWQDSIHSYLNYEMRKRPEFSQRFIPEFSYEDTRGLLVCILWNELHKLTKYEWDNWDEDFEVIKWFKDYNSNPNARWSRLGKDDESLLLNDIIERVRDKIMGYVRKNDMLSKWKIYELFSTGRESYTLEIMGDWRAQEYCRIQGIEYVP